MTEKMNQLCPLLLPRGSDSDSGDSSGTLTPPQRTPSPEGDDPEVEFKTPASGPTKSIALDPSLPQPYSRESSPFRHVSPPGSRDTSPTNYTMPRNTVVES